MFMSALLEIPDMSQLVNLHKLFFLACRFPSLEPLIRKVIKLPSNRIFDLVFLAQYAIRYSRMYGYNIPTAIRLNIRNAIRSF